MDKLEKLVTMIDNYVKQLNDLTDNTETSKEVYDMAVSFITLLTTINEVIKLVLNKKK